MKRMARVLLIIGLLCAALTGCGVQEVAEATDPGPVAVSNVDELLAAIAPGAEIVMGEGSYVLSEASDYGNAPEGVYYSWAQQEDGYQLVLHDLQGLTIWGCGKDATILETDPQYAKVLVLDGCADVRLESLAIGNDAGEKGAGLELNNCENVALHDLRVSNCGTVGVTLGNCRNVVISGSEIADCNFHGLLSEQTDGLTVENCTFRDMGNTEYGGSSVFGLRETSNVTVTGCEIRNNQVTSLIDCYPCDNVVFENNTFTDNRVQGAALDVDGGLIFDSNIVENNVIPSWFVSESSTVLDRIGKSWNEEMLAWYYSAPVEEVPDGEQEEVHVSTVDELLAAIGPNKCIVLDGDFYDLSTATDYGTGYNDYYYWTEEFDGPNLVITDVDNMTIRSADGDVKGCTISAVPRYAHVLSFRRCSNITLSGFTAGHTVEPGYCMGGVLNFRNCDNILVDNCGLYGCGILGVQAELSSVLTVKNCDIYECSYGGIQLSEVSEVVIEGCTFRDLGGDSVAFFDCKNVTVDGKAVAGNARIS